MTDASGHARHTRRDEMEVRRLAAPTVAGAPAADVRFAVDVRRITEVTATKAPDNGYAWGWYDVSCSGVEDEDPTQGIYDYIYGVHGEAVGDVKGNEVGTARFQSCSRYHRYYRDAWNGTAGGRFDMSLIGLQENAAYANQRLSEFGLVPPDANP